MTKPKPTRADDCETLLVILADAPTGGLTIEEIQEATTKRGDPWGRATVNAVICDLRSQVGFEKVRENNRKVTRYALKNRS